MEMRVEVNLLQCAAARITVAVTSNGGALDPIAQRPAPPVRQVVTANPPTIRDPSLFRDRKDDSR